MSHVPSDNVIPLESRRAQRATLESLKELEALLLGVRQRLEALNASGALYASPSNSREGRRLLRAQELLMAARSHLREATGRGPLPAPRLPATRERLLELAKRKREEAERRLTTGEAPPRALPEGR